MSEKKNNLADAVATLVQYGYFEEAKLVIERMAHDTFPSDENKETNGASQQ